MADIVQSFTQWFMGLGAQYGVDPIVFGAIYVGAIPFFSASVAWLIRNVRRGRSVAAPVLSAGFFLVSAYLYLFAVGENLPLWVYLFVLGMVGYGALATVQKVRNNTPAGAADAEARDRYDVVVIGGGAAGLTSAGVAANFGAKALMIEKDALGGDCTWTGCIPSKALLKSAEVAQQIRKAKEYGLDATLDAVDFQAVMERVRTLRRDVYEEADAPEIYEEMGIEVAEGTGRFLDSHTVAIDRPDGTTRHVTARKIVIATGGRAATPPIDGLDNVDYLTNENLFDLDEQPEHLAIIGAGPIGTEMAQAFARLGSRVTVLEMTDRILSADDPALASMLQERLEAEGVRYAFGARVERVAPGEAPGTVQVTALKDDTVHTLTADALLVAAGRRPTIETLNLDAAGVAYTPQGITVDDRTRTSQSHIYAVGDVTGRYQFTHMSEHMAKVAATNALLKVPMTIDAAHVPWVTYTDPELAHVGATEAQLQDDGTAYTTYRFPYAKVDRAITDGDTLGEIRVHATPRTGKILGASVLGARAGELISEYALAMKNGVSLREIADTIHPYPSYGLAARRAADQWYGEKQKPWMIRTLQTIFGYEGPVMEPDPDRII
ncbi:dihydrolipoyl dehydrogenase family protein [Salisaeta longa]|uniref:dihydrolipoyl dehydrogenase family protein n=1 Tax=Salisaeta longa TaxID=503170 RepID=UPI0003B423A5|nr:FAD-dependent oxidoreductase [Salisaeta longa]